MREIVVAVDSQDTIKLGYLGENNFQVVKFDITDWLCDHKNGQAVLLFKVNGMDDPYPCKVEIQGKYANWVLTESDLQYGRNGRCQLFYYADGEVVAKSSIFCTDVANSLGEQTTEPPEVFTSWVNNVLAAGLKAENAAESAKQIQQQMNETLQSAQQTFDAAVHQGLGSIEDTKEQAAQQAERLVSQLDEVADAANKTVLDTLTEGLHQIDTAQTQAVTAVTEVGDHQAERLGALVPDGYYTKEESDARYAQIDNSKYAIDTTWSSETIVQKFCPPFEVSGNIVTCNPVESIQLNTVVQIEPVQEDEGNPSPDNVRSISGWDTVNLHLCSANLFSWEPAILSGHVVEIQDGVRFIDTSGIPKFYLPPVTSFTVSFEVKATNDQTIYVGIYNKEGEYISASVNGIVGEWVKYEKSFNFTAEYLSIGGSGGLGLDTEFRFFRLVSNPNIAYEPNRGETFTIPLGQTVYGGTLDVTTGVLTKTHQNIPSYAGEDVGDDWISSTGGLTNGAQVVYRLPQPEIIQLDPVEITAFSGVNTVYADTGDVTVSGYSDPNNIINVLADRISTLEQNAIGG